MFLPDNSIFTPVVDPNMAPKRTENSRLNVEDRLNCYEEIDQVYTEEQAVNEMARCLKCPTHWCQKACPAGVPVTDFIAAARAGDYEKAYQLIRSASTLPEICSRVCPQEKQCQSNCTRGIKTQAVGIGKLERFVVEQHYAADKAPVCPAPTGKKIAVVGSGPSGLSAAQWLADLGHAVTVYERNDRPGGLLEYGIPNMKLEKGIVARKVAAMEAQGVTFKTGVRVGADVSAESLTAEYDAVILAAGTANARTLKLEGAEGVHGIYPAVEFLTANTRAVLDGTEPISAQGKRVVIVGGGDTGSDCVGTSLRQGCTDIVQIEMLPKKHGRTVIYNPRPVRPAETKVDTSLEECMVKLGKDPHVYQTTVKAVQADENGNICAITTVKLDAVYDERFRLSMKEIPGTEETIPCDMLLVAAGFIGPCGALAQAFGIDTDNRSNFATGNYATSAAKVFACGDCRTGQSLVVKAMVDGRECAKAVDAALK